MFDKPRKNQFVAHQKSQNRIHQSVSLANSFLFRFICVRYMKKSIVATQYKTKTHHPAYAQKHTQTQLLNSLTFLVYLFVTCCQNRTQHRSDFLKVCMLTQDCRRNFRRWNHKTNCYRSRGWKYRRRCWIRYRRMMMRSCHCQWCL